MNLNNANKCPFCGSELNKSNMRRNIMPTMNDVLSLGEKLEVSCEYEPYFSDAPGGKTIKLSIIRYGNKIYCHKEKIVDYPKKDRKLLAFYELSCLGKSKQI